MFLLLLSYNCRILDSVARTTETIMVIRYAQFFLLLTLLCTPLSAQFEQLYESWRWAHFTTKSGLPSNTIESIVEAADSTVWVVTNQGVAWYDGFHWNPVFIDSISADRRIRQVVPYGRKLLVNIGGRLFVGNQNGFKKMILNPMLDSGFISSVSPVNDKSFLLTVEYDHIALLIKATGTSFEVVNSPPPGKLFSTRSSIWFLGEDIDSKHHLYQYYNDSFTRISAQTGQPNAIRAIVENAEGVGVLAMDAPKNSVGLWEFSDKKEFKYSESERNQPVRSLDVSREGEVFVIYESGEVHIRINGAWKNINPLPKQLQNSLTVRYRDNDDIWVGTEEGLYLFKRSISLWSTGSTTFSNISNVVMEVFRSSMNEIWVGNMDGVEVRGSDGNRRFIRSINGSPLGLVTGINEDSEGNIWIVSGAGFRGSYRWDGSTWKHYKIHDSNIGYHKIRKDRSGALWFLGLGEMESDPAGFILSQDRWLRIDSLYTLPSNRLYAFSESRTGVKWIGSAGGLTRVSGDELRTWGREELGKNPKVYTISVEKNETVWFSTFSPLLATISADNELVWVWENDEVYNYQQKIWDIVYDESNILWVATTKGLYSYTNGVWTNYNQQTGYALRELRVVLPLNEKIYVGGHGIGVRFMMRDQTTVPIKIILNKPIVENNDVYCSWTASSHWGIIPSDQIESRYKIDNEQWSEWSVNRDLVLRDVKSGHHRIAVQAKESSAQVKYYTHTASFYVERPVFLRPLYLIPFLVMLSVVFATLARYKQAQKAHALQIQNQRTRIANDLHDEVGSNLASVALISQRLWKDESLPQFIRDDLAVVRDTAIQTGDFLRDIVWYINPRYDTFMSLETRLREIAGRMLRELNVQIEMSNTGIVDELFVESRRNIILMFKEIIHNIVKHAQSSMVTIHCEHSKDIFRLMVKDNGVGFHQEEMISGNGLLSLKRRARDAGAELKISSKIGEGTTITITFHANVTEL